MASYEKRTWWSRHNLSHRLQDESFLEAAVTTAFLVAAADGAQSDLEYDALLNRLELLGGIDRDRIDELLTTIANDVEANGFEARIARVGDLVKDAASVEAALMLGIAIALADDNVSDEEREIANQIAAATGLGQLSLDTLIDQIRG